MNFCRLVKFHTRRCFYKILFVRVSNSDHLVTYAINFCTNNPGHKIYRCILARFPRHILTTKTFFCASLSPAKMYCCMYTHSIRHHTVLYNTKNLHTKTVFAQACHLRKKILSRTKLSQSSLIHPLSPNTALPTSKSDLNTHLSIFISLFLSL